MNKLRAEGAEEQQKKKESEEWGEYFEAFIKMSQKQNAAEIKRTLCVIHSKPCEKHQQQKTDCGSSRGSMGFSPGLGPGLSSAPK